MRVNDENRECRESEAEVVTANENGFDQPAAQLEMQIDTLLETDYCFGLGTALQHAASQLISLFPSFWERCPKS